MISEKDFNKNLSILCLQESYDSEKYPSSVARIICSFKMESLKIVIKYFLENTKEDKWTLKYFVLFVRKHRDILFPNDYRKSNQKFISVFGYHRNMTMEDYMKDRGIKI